MPIVEPHLFLSRILSEDAAVKLNRLLVAAKRAEDRSLEIATGGIQGILRQQPFDFAECREMLVLAMEDYCIVPPRGREAGRKFKTARQQLLSVSVALQSRRNLSQHPDGGDVSRTLLQVLTQKRFGVRNAVLTQSRRGFEQAGVLGGAPDVPRVRGVSGGGIADGGQMPGKRQPSLRQIRLELECAAQRGDRTLTLPQRAQCDTELV